MMIIEDTRQQERSHNVAIRQYLKDNGFTLYRSKLIVGDYAIANKQNISVDTKQDISELYHNITREHERFRKECQLAKDCGIELYILTPNNQGISSIDDLIKWDNPQTRINKYKAMKSNDKYIPPVKNETLIKILKTTQYRYGCKFIFCPNGKTGEIVAELLTRKPLF